MIRRLWQRMWLWLVVFAMSAWPLQSVMAQQLGQGTDAADLTGWRVVGALVFLILLIAGAAIVVRNHIGSIPFLRKASERRINILETVRISPQAQLCLMEFEGREYLIAFAAQGASLIETRTIEQDERAK